MLTTLIGLPIEELDTPAVLIDLDALESNIKTMAADVKSRGSNWRPHSKSHKCPAIAHLQVEAGAIGVACAKLGEAEVMAANGIRDILVPNQMVGPIKARRVGRAGYPERYLRFGRCDRERARAGPSRAAPWHAAACGHRGRHRYGASRFAAGRCSPQAGE